VAHENGIKQCTGTLKKMLLERTYAKLMMTVKIQDMSSVKRKLVRQRDLANTNLHSHLLVQK